MQPDEILAILQQLEQSAVAFQIIGRVHHASRHIAALPACAEQSRMLDRTLVGHQDAGICQHAVRGHQTEGNEVRILEKSSGLLLIAVLKFDESEIFAQVASR